MGGATMVIKPIQHNYWQRAAVSEASVSETERGFKFEDQSDMEKRGQLHCEKRRSDGLSNSLG